MEGRVGALESELAAVAVANLRAELAHAEQAASEAFQSGAVLITMHD